MSRFKRLQVFNAFHDAGLVPVFNHPDPETAFGAAKAIRAGGLKILEFTNRGDHACEVFSGLEARCARELPDLILGAGSVVDAPTAALYVNAGAAFVVGPTLNAEIARLCNRRKVAYCPGCGTPSEISQAEELGCEIVKLFPGAESGGPGFVKMMLGPSPWTSIMPTGGVEPTEESLRAWFKAGVACVGMGSNLVSGEILAARDWSALTNKVAATLAIIAALRGGDHAA